MPKQTQFRHDLQALLNSNSKENGSNTPDFILADYLMDCLRAFDRAVHAREHWYGRVVKPCCGGDVTFPTAMVATPISVEEMKRLEDTRKTAADSSKSFQEAVGSSLGMVLGMPPKINGIRHTIKNSLTLI